MQLIEQASAKSVLDVKLDEDRGLAEPLPYPFMAIVSQAEMKTALLLTMINPAVNGVLLIGPRGTGKTTAVRSISDLLPSVQRSLCQYGCLPEDIETDGIDSVCPDCAKKYGQGESLTRTDRVHLIELLKVGIIDSSSIERLPESLRARFKEVLDEFESTVEDWERE